MNPGIIIIVSLLFSSFPLLPEPKTTTGTNTFLLLKANNLYSSLSAEGLSFETFFMACQGYYQLLAQHSIDRDTILTIIDYSKPSYQERLFVIDTKNMKLLYHSLVAHGKGSGETMAMSFSNQPASHKSSLGFFITADSYMGKHGYSLRIDGIENGINNNALSRAIVFHEAQYVSSDFIKKYGRLGRSFGCPALPVEISRDIINTIKNSSCLFIYAPDEQYFQKSKLVNSKLYSPQITAQ